jgi:hypothetical protein
MSLRSAVRRRFGADPRALAAYRMSLAAVVLLDLVLRSRSLVAFYTDRGVLPRAVLFDLHPTLAPYSVFALSGAAWAQWALFGATALAALALFVGYRSTLATVATGVLVVSLQVRNPLVMNGGDVVLQMLFLWALVLPVGERWSVDALRGGEPREWVASFATAGVLIQPVIIYATNAVLKFRGSAWPSGEAMEYVFSLEMFVYGLGELLAQYPAALRLFDRVWLALLVASPLLLVLMGWLRAALAAAFMAMHVGMAVTMQIGVFPLVSVVALVPALQREVWDALPGRERVPGLRALPLGRWQPRVRSSLPLVALPSLPPAAREWGRRGLTVVLAAFIAFQLLYNAASVGAVSVPDAGPLGDVEPDPRWTMFAPNPLNADLWVKAPATTAAGARVDAFHGGAFAWDKPPDVAASYPSARWRKYATNVVGSENASIRQGFAAYLCRRGNARHDAGLRNVTVYGVRQFTDLDGPEPTERVRVVSANCSQ